MEYHSPPDWVLLSDPEQMHPAEQSTSRETVLLKRSWAMCDVERACTSAWMCVHGRVVGTCVNIARQDMDMFEDSKIRSMDIHPVRNKSTPIPMLQCWECTRQARSLQPTRFQLWEWGSGYFCFARGWDIPCIHCLLLRFPFAAFGEPHARPSSRGEIIQILCYSQVIRSNP